MTRIADYTTTRLLGTGSHGQVWLAMPPSRLGIAAEHVAVKVFDRPTSAVELQAVAEELRRWVQVGSPHLSSYYDVGIVGVRLYVAMEYLPDGSLEKPTQELGADDRAMAVAAAARGAHALHEAGIAHREIKPANVLFGPEAVKLTDPAIGHLLAPGQTVTGVAPRATVEFLEPAVVRGERAARASDIWSLGVTLHWALTGASVYAHTQGPDILAVLRQVIGGTPQVDQNLNPVYRDIIGRCLAPDRSDRFPTALALAEAIEKAAQAAATR